MIFKILFDRPVQNNYYTEPNYNYNNNVCHTQNSNNDGYTDPYCSYNNDVRQYNNNENTDPYYNYNNDVRQYNNNEYNRNVINSNNYADPYYKHTENARQYSNKKGQSVRIDNTYNRRERQYDNQSQHDPRSPSRSPTSSARRSPRRQEQKENNQRTRITEEGRQRLVQRAFRSLFKPGKIAKPISNSRRREELRAQLANLDPEFALADAARRQIEYDRLYELRLGTSRQERNLVLRQQAYDRHREESIRQEEDRRKRPPPGGFGGDCGAQSRFDRWQRRGPDGHGHGPSGLV